MSNALAIAAVTAVLKDILENGLTHDAIAASIGDTLVTALPPDRISVGADERPQLNVFLYQVSPNRNADWVGRGRLDTRLQTGSPMSGSQIGQTPLALDLHYLLTAYGTKDFQAELLLGYALQLLHNMPVLTREIVFAALSHAADVSTFGVLSQALSSSSVADLADQIAPIKLGSEFFSMEETSKLWSSLQTHYRPSAGYQASMVLIQGNQPIAHPTRIAFPQPTIKPVIEQVGSCAGIELLTLNDPLVIRGKHLRGTQTRIRLGGRSHSPQNSQDTQLSLMLPADLLAGLQGVQVVHLPGAADNRQIDGQADGQEIESNLVAFVLHPIILSVNAAANGTEANETRVDKTRVNEVGANEIVRQSKADPVSPTIASEIESEIESEITLAIKPKIGKSQQVILLLYKVSPELKQPVLAYRFILPPRVVDTETLTIPVQVKAGAYAVQLQVDGAQSPLSSAAPSLKVV